MAILSETVRFTAFSALRESEISALKVAAGSQRKLQRGEVVHREGDLSPCLYFLIEGWTASSVTFASGARQLLKVHMPGDMLGVPSLAYTHAVDTITALSSAMVCAIPAAALGELFESSPRLAALLFLISQEERVMLIDRLATMGRLDTGKRLAALILQLHARLLRNDPSTGLTFHVPINQTDLADLIGVTMVHVSRVLQQFRSSNLARWSRQSITILDLEALRHYSGLPTRHLIREPSWLPSE